jgi:hypothetical protein
MANAATYPATYVEVAGRRIRVFTRIEFMTRRWSYKPGHHVLLVAPSQDGKTTLAYQLLKYTAKPTLPAFGIVMKPRDATPAMWSAHLGYPELPAWEPPRTYRWQQKPSGYTLWVPHTMNPAIDNPRIARETEKLLAYAYGRGDCIVFADEIYGLIAELPEPDDKKQSSITDLIVAISTRGSGMGVGLWGATQKPSGTQGRGLPGFLFSNAQHLFFSRDPDKRARDRYGEIGGVDPDLLKQLVEQLRRHQFVYINKGDDKGGPYIAIIDSV